MTCHVCSRPFISFDSLFYHWLVWHHDGRVYRSRGLSLSTRPHSGHIPATFRPRIQSWLLGLLMLTTLVGSASLPRG